MGQNLRGDHEGLVSSVLLRTFQDRVWHVASMGIEQLYEQRHFAVIFLCATVTCISPQLKSYSLGYPKPKALLGSQIFNFIPFLVITIVNVY